MSRVVRRSASSAPEEVPPCTVCGMPSTSRWTARAAEDIYLCDKHLEVHREALKKAEYTRES